MIKQIPLMFMATIIGTTATHATCVPVHPTTHKDCVTLHKQWKENGGQFTNMIWENSCPFAVNIEWSSDKMRGRELVTKNSRTKAQCYSFCGPVSWHPVCEPNQSESNTGATPKTGTKSTAPADQTDQTQGRSQSCLVQSTANRQSCGQRWNPTSENFTRCIDFNTSCTRDCNAGKSCSNPYLDGTVAPPSSKSGADSPANTKTPQIGQEVSPERHEQSTPAPPCWGL